MANRAGELHPIFVLVLFVTVCVALLGAFAKFTLVDELPDAKEARKDVRHVLDGATPKRPNRRNPRNAQRRNSERTRPTLRRGTNNRIKAPDEPEPPTLIEALKAHATENKTPVRIVERPTGVMLRHRSVGAATGLGLSTSTATAKQTDLPNEYREEFAELQKNPPPDIRGQFLQVRRSIVRVWSAEDFDQVTYGTGFAVVDGHTIVTARHVIEHGEVLLVQTDDNKTHEATVLAELPHRDLVALHVSRHIDPLYLAVDEQFTWKTPVFMIGHTDSAENLLDSGRLDYLETWKDFEFEDVPPLMANDTLIMHTNAKVRQGQSGSPLMTADGLVVGVMMWVRSSPATDNYCVHQQHLRELIEDVIRTHAEEGQNVAEEIAAALPPRKSSDVESRRVQEMTRFLKRMNRFEERKAKREKRAYALAVLRQKYGRRSRTYVRTPNPVAQQLASSMLYFYGL